MKMQPRRMERMSDKCRWGLQKKKVGMDQPEQRRLRHHKSRTSKQNYSMGTPVKLPSYTWCRTTSVAFTMKDSKLSRVIQDSPACIATMALCVVINQSTSRTTMSDAAPFSTPYAAAMTKTRKPQEIVPAGRPLTVAFCGTGGLADAEIRVGAVGLTSSG
jgi:hypothetical protein